MHHTSVGPWLVDGLGPAELRCRKMAIFRVTRAFVPSPSQKIGIKSVIPGGADPPGLHGRDVADLGLETPSGDGKLSLLWLGIVFGGVVVGHGRHFEGLWEEAIWKEMNDSLSISISFEYFWHSRWPVDEKKAMEAKSFGGSSYKWLSHILWPLVALRCNLIPSG